MEKWLPDVKGNCECIIASILNKQSQRTDKGWSSRLGFEQGASNSSLYKFTVTKHFMKPQAAACECGDKPSGSTECRKFLD
jgi:hypothetical protein